MEAMQYNPADDKMEKLNAQARAELARSSELTERAKKNVAALKEADAEAKARFDIAMSPLSVLGEPNPEAVAVIEGRDIEARPDQEKAA